MNINENSSNPAECAQSQTMNGHSPLFDRLSTDGKPYWDYITKYSPVIYQDINKEFADGIADLIAKFNVDGNWNLSDQWETIGVVPQVPYVYASVQETKTHLFLGYYFYHVRDDGPVPAEQHENDLEGMMMTVRKDGAYGVPVAMETISHSDFLRYRLKDPNVQPGYVGIEGTSVRYSEVTHPEVFISSNGIGDNHGHGVRAYTSNEDVGDDGIIYKFGEPSYPGQPNQFSPKWKHVYNYGILPIDELWERKFHYNNTPFQSFGVFPNTHTSNNHANAPWNWTDRDQDGTLGTGIFFTDPAYLFDIDFNGLGTFSHEYVYNPYWTHKVILKSVTPKVYKDPSNNLPDIYISMDTYPLSGKRYISEKVWMKTEATLNTPHPVIFGGDQKTANTTFSERSNTIHIAVSNINPRLWLEVKDYDPSDADDYMGSVVIPLDTGNIAKKADSSEVIIDYEVISNPGFPLAQQGVYIYKDSNFSGTSKHLTSSVTNFKDIGMNDAVSSIKIVGPYDVVGYSDADFKGRSSTLVTNDNLSSTYLNNDAMSSIRITRRTI
ncbi:beta/gamma crystallin-related protein [Paenibacillus graminis]|uniref:beta/gamma crystallin-related protein n=1 Tax=Paenibacillus graminis TaxID=189425 RepID=UPI002DBE46E5|nr:beta/gamma crystallin-related protein [Paenibacillus graminis]MEC0167177.1 beta/gamma crystallin-related protein [Paenibacillus graminis]